MYTLLKLKNNTVIGINDKEDVEKKNILVCIANEKINITT